MLQPHVSEARKPPWALLLLLQQQKTKASLQCGPPPGCAPVHVRLPDSHLPTGMSLGEMEELSQLVPAYLCCLLTPQAWYLPPGFVQSCVSSHGIDCDVADGPKMNYTQARKVHDIVLQCEWCDSQPITC